MRKKTTQPELDFDSGSEQGYLDFQQRQKDKLDRISKEWLVPINKKVRMSFTRLTGEYTGRIILLETPEVINRKTYGPLKLRLSLSGQDFTLGETLNDYIDFTSNEMGQCKILKN